MLGISDIPYYPGEPRDEEIIAQWVHTIWVRQTLGYIQVGLMAAWICDYVQSFPAELDLVWPAKWSTGKGSYLFVRYCTWPLGIIVTIYGLEEPQSKPFRAPIRLGPWGEQQPWDSVGILRVFLYGATAVTQFIFAVRTWAIWQRARWIKLLLTTLFCTVWAFELCFSLYLIMNSDYVNSDTPNFLVEHSVLAMVSWLPIALIDIVLMIFTIFKVAELLKYQSSSTTLIRVIRQDGILYFVAVTAVSVVYPVGEFLSNIAADITMLVGMQYCLYSFMACRTILNLRAAAANTGYQGQTTWTSASLHFVAARRNAGDIEPNLGAPADQTTAWFGHGLSAEPVSTSSVLVIGPE